MLSHSFTKLFTFIGYEIKNFEKFLLLCRNIEKKGVLLEIFNMHVVSYIYLYLFQEKQFRISFPSLISHDLPSAEVRTPQ